MTCDNRETRVLETLYPPQIPHGHTGTEPETMHERPTPKNHSHGTAGTSRTHQNIIIISPHSSECTRQPCLFKGHIWDATHNLIPNSSLYYTSTF